MRFSTRDRISRSISLNETVPRPFFPRNTKAIGSLTFCTCTRADSRHFRLILFRSTALDATCFGTMHANFECAAPSWSVEMVTEKCFPLTLRVSAVFTYSRSRRVSRCWKDIRLIDGRDPSDACEKEGASHSDSDFERGTRAHVRAYVFLVGRPVSSGA